MTKHVYIVVVSKAGKLISALPLEDSGAATRHAASFRAPLKATITQAVIEV